MSTILQVKASSKKHMDQNTVETVLQYGVLHIRSIAIIAAHLERLCNWVMGGYKRLRQVQPLIVKLLQWNIHISK